MARAKARAAGSTNASPRGAQRFELRLDCRYLKQYHEVSVAVPLAAIERRDAAAPSRAPSTTSTSACTATRWRPKAARSRSSTCGCRPSAPPSGRRCARQSGVQADASAARKGRRSVYIPERDAFAEVPVYDGHRMRCGHRIAGPALIEQQTTAIFVSDGFDCTVDALGSFVLYAKGRADLVARAADRGGLA
jgi:N-methylhydantoinase A